MTNLWQPLDPINIADPYPMYATLRKLSPVYKAQTGEWIISSYELVKQVLISKDVGSGNRKEWLNRGVQYLAQKDLDLSDISTAINSFILQIDPPAHTRIRKFIAQNWSKDNIDTIIEQNIKILDHQLTIGEFDIVAAFTSKLPSMTTATMMGLPLDEHNHLHGLSADMIKALDLYVSLKDLVKLADTSKKFISYFQNKLHVCNLNYGLMTTLIEQNKKQEKPLTENEMISIFIFLFVASEETSVSFISTALLLIAKHNLIDEFKTYELCMQNIEELLRYESPVQLLGRIALTDFTLGGEKIKKGDTLTLCIGSANRDEEIFSDPNSLDFNRASKHLTFGKGIHYCMGDWLIKKQAALALSHFCSKYTTISLIEEPENWYDNIAIRGMRSLKLKCH